MNLVELLERFSTESVCGECLMLLPLSTHSCTDVADACTPILREPLQIAPCKVAAVLRTWFEFGDASGPADESVGNSLEADSSRQAGSPQVVACRDCFGTHQATVDLDRLSTSLMEDTNAPGRIECSISAGISAAGR